MDVLFNHEQLFQLVTNLYTLTGIRANILNQGREVCPSLGHAPFCRQMTGCVPGLSRCKACDKRAVEGCANAEGFQFYRCHVGICEAILPIRTDSISPPIAYVVFGQFLDDSPLEDQWERTRACLDWWSGDLEELRQAFFQFRQYSAAEQKAYSEIMETLTAYIQLKGMISPAGRTDLQKLELFLDQHYMEKLSLASISAQLHIGRTKLCTLAKELSGGHTLSHMIAQRRVEAAKSLLLQSDAPISAVAEAVGISDYNYFSKVFRVATGTTPSAFRRDSRRAAGLRG